MKTPYEVFRTIMVCLAFLIGAALAACSDSTAPVVVNRAGIGGDWTWSIPVPPHGSAVNFAMTLTDSVPSATIAGISGSGVLGNTTFTLSGRRNVQAIVLHLSVVGQGASTMTAIATGNTIRGTVYGEGFAGVDSVGFARIR